MVLQSAFWDHPELCEPGALSAFLEGERASARYWWAVRRLLEGGRVVDVRRFLGWAEIRRGVDRLQLPEPDRTKWKRLLEVYDPEGT